MGKLATVLIADEDSTWGNSSIAGPWRRESPLPALLGEFTPLSRTCNIHGGYFRA